MHVLATAPHLRLVGLGSARVVPHAGVARGVLGPEQRQPSAGACDVDRDRQHGAIG